MQLDKPALSELSAVTVAVPLTLSVPRVKLREFQLCGLTKFGHHQTKSTPQVIKFEKERLLYQPRGILHF